MKTTYNKREIAQRERAKNLAIYNEAAAIAREVFNCLDIEAGKYSAAEVAAAIEKNAATWDDSKEDYLSEVIKIEIDGFSCRFPRGLVFNILNKMGTGYSITSAARVTFERSTEANERRAADIQTAAERQAQAQAAAEAAARLAEEKRARRRENDRRRRAAKKAQAQAERAQAQAEAQAAEAARRAAMTPADIERETDRQRRRAESSARRGRYIYEHSAKFSCCGDIQLINKIIVVTIEADSKKIFKCWAVGVCDSFYYICGSLTENNYITDAQRSYKTENRAAVANWIYLTRQAAQKNGWNISIYSETPAPASGYFVPDIATAAEDTIKRAQAQAEARAAISAEAANDDTANDETPAALSADIETSETDTAAPVEIQTPANDDSETDTPAAVLVPVAFVDVCETPANDDTAAPGFAAAPVPVAAPLHFWSPANDDTRRPAVVLGIETGDTTANDDTAANGHRNRHGARRWFQVAAAIVAAFLLSLFSDIERETPATAAPVEIQTPADDDTANDGTPATATETATDSAATAAPIMTPPTMEKPATAKKRQPRARRHRAALSADIERETPAAPSAEVANDDTAAPVLAVEIATPANDDTPAAVAGIETPAALSADIETSETDTAAPVEIQTPANDDTANDGTPAPSSETPATTGTPSPSTPATTGTPAPVSLSPAVLAWLLML